MAILEMSTVHIFSGYYMVAGALILWDVREMFFREKVAVPALLISEVFIASIPEESRLGRTILQQPFQ